MNKRFLIPAFALPLLALGLAGCTEDDMSGSEPLPEGTEFNFGAEVDSRSIETRTYYDPKDEANSNATEWKIFWKIRLPMAKPGIISGVTLAFARAIGEYGATSMLAGNIAGKTSTISQQIAMVVQSGDYATAGFWCIVIIAISFACLVSINMICGKSKGIKRKRKNNVAHSKNKKTVG